MLTARPLAGQPTPSSESSEVRWVLGPRSLGTGWTGQCASASTTPGTQQLTGSHLAPQCPRPRSSRPGRPVTGPALRQPVTCGPSRRTRQAARRPSRLNSGGSLVARKQAGFVSAGDPPAPSVCRAGHGPSGRETIYSSAVRTISRSVMRMDIALP